MDTSTIIEEIKKQLTGDPQKDGPFLKDQSEKYKNEENSDEINRELAKLMYECTFNDVASSVNEHIANNNPSVAEKLRSVRKRFDNLNYKGGIEILRGIIKDNLFAWIDTDEITYKSFGTPIEHGLYMQIYQPEKQVRPISCHLSEVYSLYGSGLFKKQKYTEAIDAFKKAIDLNPTDAEIYVRYAELLKEIKQIDELRICTDKIMQCAVTKQQLGKGYFNYSFYFSEKGDLDKAYAMLEMSRIFLGAADHAIMRETQYISECMGRGATPPAHNQQQLMQILETEGIQPGPSAMVVNTAYFLAKHSQQELEYEMAKYYYEVVWELTENDEIADIIAEIDRTIRNLKGQKSK